MLGDKNTYLPIETTNQNAFKTKTNQLIKYSLLTTGGIKQNQFLNIAKRPTKVPHFYGIVKIHKPNHPFRPIISQINSATYEINSIVDKYLEIAVKNIPEVLEDTTHFLNKIKDLTVNSETTLITADITSLYTNIPQIEGAIWVSDFYRETLTLWTDNDKRNLTYLPPTKLKEMIIHILKSTEFEFNGKHYKQLYGTTMGAIFSVKYAQIYMHQWVRKFQAVHKEKIFDIFLRFIDDIFSTTNVSKKELNDYFFKLNNFHETIKFTFETSETEVHFLDVKIYKHNNKLETTLFTKPTDRKKYLHYTSAHPKSNKNGIPKSQMIRIRRNVSNEEDFKNQIEILTSKFLERDYPDSLLQQSTEYIQSVTRESTLIKKSLEEKREKFKEFLKGRPFLPLIINFHPIYEKDSLRKKVEEIFKKELLKLNPHSRNYLESSTYNTFNNCLPQVVYAKNKTLGDILTRSKLIPTEDLEDETLNNLIYLANIANY